MTVRTPVYLDYAATTPIDKRVTEKMIPYLTETFGNPASNNHAFGWKAEGAIEKARTDIAALINIDSEEITFTSGATESDNLAVKGTANFYETKGRHLTTVKTEHEAVLDTMHEFERQGFEVTYPGVKENGLIDLEELKATVRDDTILISVMWMSSEIGIMQDIPAISGICRERKIVFHIDAAQACGKVPADVGAVKIDLLSVSGHEVYGPKGIGTLYVRRKLRVRLEAQVHGGDHEHDFRSGTLSTHQVVGMGEAFRIAGEGLKQDIAHYRKLRDIFLKDIKGIEEVYINGGPEHRAPNNPNVDFNFIGGESLIMAVKELAISSGSACISASLKLSHVLRALGHNDELAHSSLRITFGRMTTEEEVQFATELIESKIGKLRELSPLWEVLKDGIDLSSIEWVTH